MPRTLEFTYNPYYYILKSTSFFVPPVSIVTHCGAVWATNYLCKFPYMIKQRNPQSAYGVDSSDTQVHKRMNPTMKNKTSNGFTIKKGKKTEGPSVET